MSMLNRCAVVLVPKQPYVEWSKNVFEDKIAFNPDEPDTLPVFLCPNVDFTAEAEEFVMKHFSYFFEHWLEGWCTDETLWPKRRTRKLFREWFDIRIHSWVEELVDGPYELLD